MNLLRPKSKQNIVPSDVQNKMYKCQDNVYNSIMYDQHKQIMPAILIISLA